MGTTPSIPKRAPDTVRLGVYFDRDRAGLSNLRIQLESLLAICKAFGRFLVLPPPQFIAHLDDPYHESIFWSMSHLSSHVPIVLGSESAPPDDAYEVQRQISSFELDELPRDSHWYFTNEVSRIQHFETLKLPKIKREEAARCVFESFELHPSHHAAATRLLQKVGVTRYAYVAVHLRKGDFRNFRPQWYKSAEEIAQGLASHTRGKIVLILSDAAKDDSEIEKLKTVPGALQTVLVSQMHEVTTDLVVNAAVDMLIGRWSENFLGTSDSTFTNGIFCMRTKDSLTTKKGLDATPLLLFDVKPLFDCQGLCWNKITHFDNAPWLV